LRHLKHHDKNFLGRGVYISQSEPPRKREDYGLEATSKEKRTDFDTSNVKIKFSNHETDIVVDGFFQILFLFSF